MARVLLTTVFKPFGIDNLFGRRDSFVECLHNRVTRVQGIFSFRSFFSAFGLHVIANNTGAESTVLEYPTYERFLKEIRKGYDYVGIGSVVANFQKIRVMAEAVRKISPRTKIMVGGYCAHIDHIKDMIPIDYLCTGEGISFVRELLGEPAEYDFKNPNVYSRAHSFFGVPMFGRKHPHIIVGLGCPYGCEYCAPSHHFGRKYQRFLKTGEEIFREMERMEKVYKTREISFLGDDNFLFDMKRAEELRECVVRSGKDYKLFYFASANLIDKFGVEKMAEMGTNLVWIGRESTLVPMAKRGDVDLKKQVADLQRYGIKVIVSSILLMEHHTPENIWTDVSEHLSLKPDFSMFGLYSALPGTPVYDRMKEENRINWGVPYEDWNALWRQWFQNPNFSPTEGERIHDEAMYREYEELGPSAMRLIRTELNAWAFLRESAKPVLRRRAEDLAKPMPMYRALLWAMARMAPTPRMRDMVDGVLADVENSFGPITAWEKAEGLGLMAFGTKEKIRHRLWGDVIQPPTTVTRYPAGH